MILLEENLNKFMRDIIDQIIGTAGFAIKAQQPQSPEQQSAPRPEGLYASVHIVSINKVGWEEETFENQPDPDLDLVSTRQGWREILYSLNFYRTNSMDAALAVQIGLMRNSVLESITAVKLGLGQRSDVRDISEALDSGWEERAQFDVTMTTVASDTDIVTAIEEVNIDGRFEPFDDRPPIPVTIGVTTT